MVHYPEILEAQLELLKEKKRFALVTVLSARTPSALKPGSKAIVTEDGALKGWLGGSCTTSEIIDAALEAIRTDQNLVVRRFDTCQGGEVEVLIEVFKPKRTLIVVGNQKELMDALTKIASVVGLQVEHLPVAEEGVEETFKRLEDTLKSSASNQICSLIVTMGFHDQSFAEKILAANPAYLGVIAGKKRAEAIRTWLASKGVPESLLRRVRIPAGLNIGARTPEEIALSVVAEVVMVLNEASATLEREESAAQRSRQLVDPVCGMLVDESSKYSLLVDGERIAFCSEQCMEAYLSTHRSKN